MNYYGEFSKGPSVLEQENRQLAREIAREGFVLLKNNGALPLKKSKIALYGVGGRSTVKGRTGSGSVNERYSVSIEEGLLNAGYEITTTDLLDDFDRRYEKAYQGWHDEVEEKMGGRSIMETIGLVVGTPFHYPDFPEFTEKTVADTAIYVLTTQAGEGNDRRVTEGDYLLTQEEMTMIDALREAYEKLILVINVGGLMDISGVVEKVDSIVFFGQGGEEGGNALADLLSGHYNFSGKLTNTWAKDYYDYPNADKFGPINDSLEEEDYTEDIYVGYRYFDSFNKEVLYPFGYGLSYTQFIQSVDTVSLDGTVVSIKVDVTNEGSAFAGKEIVQAYVSCPDGKLEKEYQRLVSFGKTVTLEPESTSSLNLNFDLSSLASYDSDSATWIMEAGAYILRVGASSRDTELVAVFRLDSTLTIEKCEHCCIPVEALEVFSKQSDETHQNIEDEEVLELEIDTEAFTTINNIYSIPELHETDEEKALLDALTDAEMAELLRGGDLRGRTGHSTIGAGGKTVLTLAEKGIGNITMADGPAGINICNHLKRTSNGTELPLVIPERFDWGTMAQDALAAAARVDGKEVYRYATAWPVGIVLAQTWNTDYAEAFGRGVGAEMQAFGLTLWLAPGMNINRNPLCGRVFEYFSEDPFVTGEIAKYITRGTQSHKGMGVTIKHFVCNNQEDNRTGVSANVSERALREIYLKGFEIAVKGAKPLAIMSSYNRINGVYAPNNHDLLNKIARCEWGFDGLVMTDWSSCNEGLGKPELGAPSGNDLIMPGSDRDEERIIAAVEDGSIDKVILRRAACRVLRVILRGIL